MRELAAIMLLSGAAIADEANVHFADGGEAFARGDFRAAAKEYEAAKRVRPGMLVEYNLGLAREGLGQVRLAADAYRSYLLLEPWSS
jgi:hypothetical protein